MMTPNPLDSLNYPQIDETISREFGNPISALEIQDAIKSMQNGRSPGPDGFTVEFYKAFLRIFGPDFGEGISTILTE